jgi:hypothetical protein
MAAQSNISGNIARAMLLSLCAGCATGETIERDYLPDAVASLVAPVIRAQAEVAKHDDEQSEAALLAALSPVLQDRSPTGSEALVYLLGVYVGESSGEDIACELVGRGNEVVPLLHRYEASQLVPREIDPALIRRSADEYPIVEARIRRGETCVVEQ